MTLHRPVRSLGLIEDRRIERIPGYENVSGHRRSAARVRAGSAAGLATFGNANSTWRMFGSPAILSERSGRGTIGRSLRAAARPIRNRVQEEGRNLLAMLYYGSPMTGKEPPCCTSAAGWIRIEAENRAPSRSRSGRRGWLEGALLGVGSKRASSPAASAWARDGWCTKGQARRCSSSRSKRGNVRSVQEETRSRVVSRGRASRPRLAGKTASARRTPA